MVLIGWRTRSWMILPAAALYKGALWLTRGYEIGNYNLVIAGGFCGAPLLSGTRLLPRTSSEHALCVAFGFASLAPAVTSWILDYTPSLF